ncbi:MAG: Rieske 2Fe-2S domain-containing protein [Pyrinomonadaceae bacterium]|nr:Rieske 2Fe-2S domain-containing protein [Pyrinomonadaceae bacterium]
MPGIEVNSDIALADCLSQEFYLSDESFERSREAIFARSWQFAAFDSEIENLYPFTLLEGVLNEPLLLTRGEGVNCVSNVCSHRANILVHESCRSGGIKCGYHGRRFGLDGKFESMPEFEGVQNFPTAADDLSRVERASWLSMHFVSLDKADGFEEFFGQAKEVFPVIPEPQIISTRVYEVEAHWALYCENYLEGFHIPFVHRSLNKEIDYEEYTTTLGVYSSLQTARLSSRGNKTETDEYKGKFTQAAAYYFFVFPNMMFNFYPWGVSVNIVEPVTKEQTTVRYFTIVIDESQVGSGAGGDLDKVEREDQSVVESVQKGIRSRLYNGGRYSVKRETGTHHFHRLIAKFMNSGESE